MIHHLKTHPNFFKEVKSGKKNFELRKNDRDFQINDEILLEEFIPEGFYEDQIKDEYTGEICHKKITYVLKDYPGLEDGYAILGIKPI